MDALSSPKRPQRRLLLRLRPFWPCRSRSKSGIFDLPSKLSLDLATKPFSDSLLRRNRISQPILIMRVSFPRFLFCFIVLGINSTSLSLTSQPHHNYTASRQHIISKHNNRLLLPMDHSHRQYSCRSKRHVDKILLFELASCPLRYN